MHVPSRLVIGSLALALAVVGASAADKADPDWPCIQRKVPAISPAMMWAGPEITGKTLAAWRDDPEVAGLVPRLAARRTDLDETDKLIEDFASKVPAGQRSRRMTLLFAGVLDQINTERRRIMDGIERYTRKQRALADSVTQTRDALVAAERQTEPSQEQLKERRDLEQKLAWQSRIYEERERSLTYVCESPVLLEQRAFALARTIANHLE